MQVLIELVSVIYVLQATGPQRTRSSSAARLATMSRAGALLNKSIGSNSSKHTPPGGNSIQVQEISYYCKRDTFIQSMEIRASGIRIQIQAHRIRIHP